MDRLTKLLIAAVAFAVTQTVTTLALFRNAVGASSMVFCWVVVGVVAWRRSAQSGNVGSKK